MRPARQAAPRESGVKPPHSKILRKGERMAAVIVWFGNDLRLDDHPALSAAARAGEAVIPVFIWAPVAEGAWAPGAASRWWLHHSLAELERELKRVGSRLILRVGDPLEQLEALTRESGAEAVYRQRRLEPDAARSDARVKEGLERLGVKFFSLGGGLLFEPDEVRTKQGGPYRVFTPFWRACQARAREMEGPLPSPAALPKPEAWPESAPLESLGLLPQVDWAGGLRQAWRPGAAGAEERLHRFLENALAHYPAERDRPDHDGTSGLSPHLHFGEISPRRIWHGVRESLLGEELPGDGEAAEAFLRQLAWREFACHMIHHYPHTTQRPLRAEFERFPWADAPEAMEAWRRGRTGAPLVDAGMRQLWATGWMHNRVRMIAASFLVKNLLVPWLAGARWFWETLVDADVACNTFGWQWVAGCGADAAPFFRVFNPVSQGERFDPQGDYVRRWVPELARLPAEWIHKPHQAPAEALRAAGVEPGGNYPRPVVNLEASRREALIAYARFKAQGKGD